MKLNIPTLVLLDPALREFGGHHPGIIASLSKAVAITENKFKLLVYANENCSSALIEQLSVTNSIVIQKYFKTDFYQNFYSKEKVETFNTYIQTLANEYYSAFKKHETTPTTFYYHTLNWEHAYALSLAISLFNHKYEQRHQHLVCLMYNPCDFQKDNIDKDRLFKFSLGFRLLGKEKGVSFFATEYELAKHYENILEHKIDWCPCGLISSRHLNEISSKSSDEFNNKHKVLLYLGDAKVNKGFLALPDMLKDLTKSIIGKNITFTIQYTITNNDDKLTSTDRQLQEISRKNSQVIIITEFLTDKKMHQLLLQTNHIIFNYNEWVYSHQSSGVLWLAAAYKMHIYLLTNTWLNREAKRLTCNHYTACNSRELVEILNLNTREKYAANIKCSTLNCKHIKLYKSRLFSDIGNWLNEKLTTKGDVTWKI
ncbi:MAG: hypothetical protein HRT54_06740 [Colwellia sp.]|nr:hypothetical protein [Colwellia sp.]